jgi:hypothetical protein
VGALLDVAFDVLRARFWTCMGLTVPLWMVVWGVHRVVITTQTLDDAGLAELGELVVQGAGQSAVRALAIALVTLVVYGHLQGRPLGAVGALRASLRRAPALFALTLITGVGMFLATACGAVCLFVPAILLSWLWAVAPAALVLEHVGPVEALSRSASLARRSFPRWVGVMLTQFGLTAPILAVMAGLNDPNLRETLRASSGIAEPWFSAADLALVSVLSGFATALSAVVLTVYYLDQRVRVDGLDLEMGLERLGRRLA